ALLVAPEHDSLIDFMLQLFRRHVRVGPAIRRDDASIGLRAVVDDGSHQLEVVVVAAADHDRKIESVARRDGADDAVWAHLAVVSVAASTVMAGGVLAIVVLHMLTN